MKAMKKILAVLLTLTLVAALIPAALATAVTPSITVPNLTGHTYEIYQIFTGDIVDGEMQNIVWGANGTGTEGEDVEKTVLDAIVATKSLTDVEKLAEITKYVDLTSSATECAAGETEEVETGYYLIKDKDGTLDAEGSDAYTLYLVKVVAASVTLTPKADKPTLDKQIKHNELGTWDVVGDNQIGDTVEFRTITTVPEHTEDYTTYVYKITDEMSVGLTSNVAVASDVKIKINDDDEKVLDDTYYTVTVDSSNSNSFVIDIDIKAAIADDVFAPKDKLYSYYTGVLNEDALIYLEGKQQNEAYLSYSNNPNSDSDEEPVDTPHKIVYDWTFKMDISKIDGVTKTALDGAKFVLTKAELTDVPTLTEGTISSTTGLIGMVANGSTYRVATAEDAADSIVYVISATNGAATIKGLDDSIKYYLYEVEAPDGYNILTEPVTFTITASYNESGDNYTSVSSSVDGDEPLTAVIENNFGAVLPSTGGIGTTLFYVFGSILVIGAGVLLVSKKRMGAAE